MSAPRSLRAAAVRALAGADRALREVGRCSCAARSTARLQQSIDGRRRAG
jgi:hypothetical protein